MKEIRPAAWVERTEDGHSRMWSGDLSAWANRPAKPEPLYDQATVNRLASSRDFYKRRCEALQAVQNRMRDPERKAVCDILANGETYAYASEDGANVEVTGSPALSASPRGLTG